MLLVIVAGMLAAPAAFLARPKSVAPTPIPVKVPLPVPSPAPRTSLPGDPGRGVSALLAQSTRSVANGALQEAEDRLRQALQIKPSDPEIWSRLGVVLVRQGETTRGAEAFERAVRLDPGHAEAHRNLAITRDREGRTGEATLHYRAFLRLSRDHHPDRSEVRRRLAEMASGKAEP